MDIGIDFGSTYTTVSVFNQASEMPVPISLNESNEVNIASVLAIVDGEVCIGAEAKATDPELDGRQFRAFKMLLAETDKEKLRLWGYDDEYTPRRVTRMFLEEILKQCMERLDDDRIDHLYIGVPEIWGAELKITPTQGAKTGRLDSMSGGRAILKEICMDLPMIKNKDNVRVVSEPVAASAFFSNDIYINKNKEEMFDGHMLMIDYGGGTLDVTVTEIRPKDFSGDKSAMEISARFETGAGENMDHGEIGKAGLVYMEALAKEAIKAATGQSTVEKDSDFIAFLDALEHRIQGKTKEIRKVIETYGSKPADLTKDEFIISGNEKAYYFAGDKGRAALTYKLTYIPISYELMARVYSEQIAGVLNSALKNAKDYMDRHGIDYSLDNADHFKFIISGGFGNFYFVKAQVADFFKIRAEDPRSEYIFSYSEKGERAVSYGATILSAGKVLIRRTAPYTLAVAAKTGSEFSRTFALKCGDDINYDEEYIQKDNEGNYRLFIGKITELLYGKGDDLRGVLAIKPKDSFVAEANRYLVANLTDTGYDTVGFIPGFSIDSSGIITLYLHEMSVLDYYSLGSTETLPPPVFKKQLTDFNNLYETQEARPAFPNG